jgi:hypothetical protein
LEGFGNVVNLIIKSAKLSFIPKLISLEIIASRIRSVRWRTAYIAQWLLKSATVWIRSEARSRFMEIARLKSAMKIPFTPSAWLPL